VTESAARKRTALALLILATKKTKEENKTCGFLVSAGFRVIMAPTFVLQWQELPGEYDSEQAIYRASHPSSTTGHP
jgi:hypothetical protein